MSETEKLVRESLTAFEQSDWDAIRDQWAPDGVAVGPPDWPETGELVGWEAIRDQFERLKSDWAEDHIEVEQLEEPRPGIVFVRIRWVVTGAGSGIPLDVPMWMVATIRDGKIVRAEFFQQEQPALAALEAAGR